MNEITEEIDQIIFSTENANSVLRRIESSKKISFEQDTYQIFFRIRIFKTDEFLQNFIQILLKTDKAKLLTDSVNIIAIKAINVLKAAIQTRNEMITNLLIDNFEKIIKANSYDTELLNEYRKLGIDKERLRSIQEDVINELSGNNFISFIQSANQYEGLQVKFDYNSFTRQLLKKDEKVMQDEVAIQMVSRLIQELCKHEGLDISQIEYGGIGNFNTNLKIGEYVLKIASKDKKSNRRTVKIRNDKRIIRPILRQQTNIQRRKNIPNLFIEIQDYVDTNWFDGLSEKQIQEALYSIFSELMDRGLRWTDIKPENIGRLRKPNAGTYTVDGKEQISSDYAVSYYGDMPQEILKRGELVIIDTDYIYETKWVKNIKIPRESYYEDFIARYEREKEENKIEEPIINDSVKSIIIDGGYTQEKARSTLGKLLNLIQNRFKGR